MSTAHASSIPRHIAVIMDGNRRWAKQHGLAVLQGHEYVANRVIQPLVETCIELGVKYLTLWAFSTENWRREQTEVAGLMDLFRAAFSKNAAELHERGVRLKTIGNLRAFPEDIQHHIADWIEKTKDNTAITVVFALNYGGRDEILRAVSGLIPTVASEAQLTEVALSAALDTGREEIPDPDFIIRPGGEVRLSGYLPWQSVYSELYFSDVLMPDFGADELRKAVEEYGQRQRRFGG